MGSIALKKVMVYNVLLMTITSLHHVYGAWRYDTPWRLHALMLSIPVIVVIGLLYRLIKKEGSPKFLFWIFWVITLVPSVMLIGIYEGVYNHLFKNIVYFAGAGQSTLDSLFQPGLYEMPNDFIFEFTGILQAIVLVPLIVYFVRLTAFSMFAKTY